MIELEFLHSINSSIRTNRVSTIGIMDISECQNWAMRHENHTHWVREKQLKENLKCICRGIGKAFALFEIPREINADGINIVMVISTGKDAVTYRCIATMFDCGNDDVQIQALSDVFSELHINPIIMGEFGIPKNTLSLAMELYTTFSIELPSNGIGRSIVLYRRKYFRIRNDREAQIRVATEGLQETDSKCFDEPGLWELAGKGQGPRIRVYRSKCVLFRARSTNQHCSSGP